MEHLDLIPAFQDKHNIRFERYIDPEAEILKFSDGRFYDIKDIYFDIAAKIPAGTIQRYADEGLKYVINECYEEWYKQRLSDTIS